MGFAIEADMIVCWEQALRVFLLTKLIFDRGNKRRNMERNFEVDEEPVQEIPARLRIEIEEESVQLLPI